MARDLFKAAEAPEYITIADMLEALRMGKVDAALLSHSYIKQLVDSGMYPDFEYLWLPEEVYVNKAAPMFHSEELRDKYNEWFQTAVDDGTWQEEVDRWIGVPLPAQEDIPIFGFTGENGILRAVDTGNYPPLAYMDANGEPAGFEVEMVNRFALYMGMTPEFTMMAYDAIMPYVVSGKADMSAATITLTDEREDGIIFGEPSVITQAVLIIKKNDGPYFSDFYDKRLGVITGTIIDDMARRLLNAEPVYYSADADAIEDVRNGRLDGFMNDLSTVRAVTGTTGNDDLLSVEIPAALFTLPMGAISSDQYIIDRFNAFLAGIKADGTFNAMQSRWLGASQDLDSPMPVIPAEDTNGTLIVATNSSAVPFAFIGEDNELTGYSIELARRFAAHENMGIEFADMDFDGQIPYIMSGKADLAISSISITEERKKSVLFTDSIYDDGLSILVLKQPEETVPVIAAAPTNEEEPNNGGFIGCLKTGIRRNLTTDNRWKMIVNGLGVTMLIAFLAQVIGTGIGCAVCCLLTRRGKIARALGGLYCGLIHGTPVVVLLLITYYIIFGTSDISNVLVAVAAFSMITGAGVAENLHGAIITVEPTEAEAARSIGFSALGAFFTVTLPQAVRRAVPGYANGFVELVKATSIVGYIAIQDLTRSADIIRSRTFDAYFPLILVAVIYLVITTVCVRIFKAITAKINRGVASEYHFG
jgi:polar amino acid transport system substrate-binding protein